MGANVKEPVETTVNNKNHRAITAFFADRQRNANREEWFDPNDISITDGVINTITNSLQVFFQKKKWYNGGSIPCELLFTIRNFRLVNNIALLDAVDIAYRQIGEQKRLARTPYKKNVEVLLALKVIRDCESKQIPQDHIGGLLLLYLELCERVVLL